MTYWNLENLPLAPFRPGIKSIAETGQQLIMVCMEVEPGQQDSGHSHPFDQCGVVLEGEIEMFIGAEAKLLGPNQSYFIPAGVVHGWKTLNRSARLLDVSLKQPDA